MSEHQYVAFRAVDRPLTDKELAFAGTQSSRAEISRWSFENEYHYGDFRGNAQEMLRRGYDVHLHYANFGIRKLMVRLTGGMPCDKALSNRSTRRLPAGLPTEISTMTCRYGKQSPAANRACNTMQAVPQ